MPTSRAFDKRGQRRTALGSNSLPRKSGSLEAQFASFATTIQQRMDEDSGGSPTLSGSLGAQVERAVSQAMRRGNVALAAGGPGTGNGSSGGYGVMPGNAGAAQPAMAAGPRAGAAVQLLPVDLPPQQAVLASEAAIAQNDLLAALDSLQPLSVLSDPGDIAAYRDIIRAEVVTLTAEFARADLPRPARAKVLLGGLLGFGFPAGTSPAVGPPATAGVQTGDVAALLFLLNLGRPRVPSSFVDQQDALQEVVAAATTRLLELWVEYQYVAGGVQSKLWLGVGKRQEGVGGSAAVGAKQPVPVVSPPPSVTGSYSQRIIIANQILPVISQDALQIAGALDAIGFGPGPQETTPVNGLQSLVDGDLFTDSNKKPEQQKVLAAQSDVVGPTMKDLLDWASDLSGAAGLDAIRQGGQLGLNLLADQADELFFIIEAVLQANPATKAAIGLPELFDPQVQLKLRSLARDLTELADQGI